MDYYRLLHLEREPFSNSPDPAFFYRSEQHANCLNQLEIAVRLGRGLNLLVGPVGTGKTTLCRQLYRQLSADPRIDVHLLLDPGEVAEDDFLPELYTLLTGKDVRPEASLAGVKDDLKRFLFYRSMEQGGTLVLLLDEAQKLSPARLEVLRELLNYETNERKLLQIVLFAQQEIDALLARCENAADRINLRLTLQPLSRNDTARMIRYRLDVAGTGTDGAGTKLQSGRRVLFTNPALTAVHRATGGSPRQIVHLCHRLMLALILKERSKITSDMVADVAGAKVTALGPRLARAGLLAAAGLVLAVLPQSLAISPKPPEPLRQGVSAPVALPQAKPLEQTAQPGTAEAAPLALEQSAPPAPAPAQLAVADEPKPVPKLLGKLPITPRETLWTMAGRVYGDCDTNLLKTVAAANDQFDDPGRIPVGAEVKFPTLAPVPAPRLPYVQVGSYATLPEAYELMLTWRKRAPLKLLTVHTPAQGVRYLVTAGGFAKTQARARSLLGKLPKPLAKLAKIMEPLPEGTRLLAGARRQWTIKAKAPRLLAQETVFHRNVKQ